MNSPETMFPKFWMRPPKLTFRPDVFRWPRTGDEDIYQSPGALLPVRAGRHVGDPDKRAKQIEWIEVFPYVATVDGALHQRINRSVDLSAGTLIQLRCTSDVRVQRRSDDLLRRDVIDE